MQRTTQQRCLYDFLRFVVIPFCSAAFAPYFGYEKRHILGFGTRGFLLIFLPKRNSTSKLSCNCASDQSDPTPLRFMRENPYFSAHSWFVHLTCIFSHLALSLTLFTLHSPVSLSFTSSYLQFPIRSHQTKVSSNYRSQQHIATTTWTVPKVVKA